MREALALLILGCHFDGRGTDQSGGSSCGFEEFIGSISEHGLNCRENGCVF